MKILKYGFFGEDEAQRIFLKNYLKQLVTYTNKSSDLVFDFVREAHSPLRGISKTKVVAHFAEAALAGFVTFRHDVFFIGRDLDAYDSAALQAELKAMKAALQPDFKRKPSC